MKKYTLLLVLFVFTLTFLFHSQVQAGAICTNCLTTSKSVYQAGEAISFNIVNASPNSPIYWTFTKDGTVLLQDYYNSQVTDSSGNLTWDNYLVADTNDVGMWEISMEAGNVQASTTFQIVAPTSGATNTTLDPNNVYYNTFSLTSDKTIYNIGDTPVFSVSGAGANTPIYWQLYKNGTKIFSYITSGKITSGNGTWNGSLMGQAEQVDTGSYLLVIKIGEQRGFASFSVGTTAISIQPPQLTATVGQAMSTQPLISYSGSAALDISITHIPDGLTLQIPFHFVTDSDGFASWDAESISPNSSTALKFSGTPTKAGNHTMIVNFYSGDTLFDLRAITINIQNPITEVYTPPATNNSPTTLTYPEISLPPSLQGQVVKTIDSPAIYYVSSTGWKIVVPSMKVLASYKVSSQDVRLVSESELSVFPSTTYIKTSNSARVYKLEGKYKRYLTSVAANRLNIFPESVITVNNTEFQFYKSGKSILK